jgi:hypothetical protein
LSAFCAHQQTESLRGLEHKETLVNKNARRIIALIVALLAPIIPAILLRSAMLNPAPFSDLPEYYAAVKLIEQGKGQLIYVWDELGKVEHSLFPAMGERIVGLFVPPPAVPLLMPLRWLPADHSFLIWTAVLSFALVLSLCVLKYGFQMSSVETLMIWSVLSISGPAYEAIRIGQVAPLLLLAFSLTCVLMELGMSGIAALPLTVLFLKPQELLPFVVYLFGCAKYRTIMVLILMAVVMAAASVLLIGVDGYVNYANLMSFSMQNTQGMQPELSPTVRGQLLRLMPQSHGPITAVSTTVLALSLVLIFFLGRKFKNRRGWLWAGLIGAMPLGLVTSLHCHDYDLILLVPTAIALLKTSTARKLPTWLKLAAIVSLPLFLLPLYTYIHYGGLLNGMRINPLFFVLLIFSVVTFSLSLTAKSIDQRDEWT